MVFTVIMNNETIHSFTYLIDFLEKFVSDNRNTLSKIHVLPISSLDCRHMNTIYAFFKKKNSTFISNFTTATEISLFKSSNRKYNREISFNTTESCQLLRIWIQIVKNNENTDTTRMKIPPHPADKTQSHARTRKSSRTRNHYNRYGSSFTLRSPSLSASPSPKRKKIKKNVQVHDHILDNNNLLFPKTSLHENHDEFEYYPNDMDDTLKDNASTKSHEDCSLMDAIRLSASGIQHQFLNPADHPDMKQLTKDFVDETNYSMYYCKVCKERWFLDANDEKDICQRCKKDPLKCSSTNDMDPLSPREIEYQASFRFE